MADQVLICKLIDQAKERNKRLVDILTTFLQEASVLIFVFGILDTWSSGKLTPWTAVLFSVVGFVLLIAAVVVKRVFDWLAIRKVLQLAKLMDGVEELR